MKKKFIYTLLLAVPMAMVADNYNMLIHKKSGEVITMPVDEVEKIDFEQIVPEGQLATPVVSYEILSETSVKVSWKPVAGAGRYFWRFDSGTTSTTDETSYTFKNLALGSHKFSVQAKAASGSSNTDSEFATIEFVLRSDTQDMRIFIQNFGHDSARVLFHPGKAEYYKVALFPASSDVTDAEIISRFSNLSGEEILTVTQKTEKVFSGLKESTEYVVAAMPCDKSDVVYRRSFITEAKPEVGATLQIFPPGVSKTAGFVDVDKVGDTEYGSDRELCWACEAAGMVQWWINQYKASTGKDYPFKVAYPQESRYYATPVMDVISQAYTHQAGDLPGTIKWFFCGVEHPESQFCNDLPKFNLDYENVKGGFMGLTENEMDLFGEYASVVDIFAGMNSEQMKATFCEKMLGWLRYGPVYVCLAGNHALSAWGAEYTIQANGQKVITKLYISENDLRSGNEINAIQDAPVSYTDFSGKTNYPYIKFPTIHDGGSESSGMLGVFYALKSWESVMGSTER